MDEKSTDTNAQSGNDQPARYPKEWNFDKCPNCGGQGIIQDELKHRKKAGYVDEARNGFMFSNSAAIMDPIKPALQIPRINAYYDICRKCGTVFCIHAFKQLVAAPPMKQAVGKLQLPGNLGQN